MQVSRSRLAYALVLLALSLLSACGDETRVASSQEPVFGDPCKYLSCGHGVCEVDGAGEPQCACEAGYSGGRCDQCDLGYHRNLEQLCVIDRLCSDSKADPCGAHGRCDDSTGAVMCTCHFGYDGARCGLCISGFERNPFDECLQLVLTGGNADASDPLTLPPKCTEASCSGHGDCNVVNNKQQCACFPGYEGARCDLCGKGFVLRGAQCVQDLPCNENQCDLCERFSGAVGFPERPSNCLAADTYDVGDLKMVSMSGSGEIWLCGPEPLYGMTSSHVALEAGADRPAEITFRVPIKKVRLDYGLRSFGITTTAKIEFAADDKVVKMVEERRLTTGPIELTFASPVTRVSVRSLGKSLEEVAIDNVVYEEADCN